LWGFIVAIAIAPDHMNHALMDAKSWVADVWSWLYIISQDIWIVVLIYLAAVSKYGSLKLGRDDEEPRFSDVTWFSLLFTCGVAVGMFYYVAEPMWHFKGWGGARFVNAQNGYSHPSEDAVHGMMVTWYHWGLHGWIPYTTIGALLGLLAYRRGFPLSVRFGLYPLIGDKVYGWMGDLVDILSIVTTIMGVCTSLGLGTMSINMGMQRLSLGFYRGVSNSVPDDPKYENPTCAGTGNKYWAFVKDCDEKWSDNNGSMKFDYDRESYGIQANFETQTAIICAITCIATISVVSGLDRGIKDLSRLGFALSCFLLLFVLFAGDTWFQLNLCVQTLGYYIWYLPKIAFHTDAFELLNTAEHGRGGFATQGSDGWMNDWTIFYWGWWISWAPFVGTFMAQISRGRTLRQFVLATLVVPSLYTFLWFGCLGGEAIKMQSMAESSGLCTKGWLNGGTKTAPATKNCMLSDDELDDTTGQCKSATQLIADGIIESTDEANCGRRACSSDTLTKGRCGKLLPTCDHYAATYSHKQKVALGLGFTPSCVLKNNGPGHPVLSGKCQKFAWEHYEQKMGSCVKVTTWVDVPCGAGADPTAKLASDLNCGGGSPAPEWCQDMCKNVITPDQIDLNNPDRMYNHFTAGGVKSNAAEHILEDLNNEFGPNPNLDMNTVWVADASGKKTYQPPSCFVPAPDNQACLYNQLTEDILFDLIGTLTHTAGFADFLSVIALGSLVIYFVTSSDSGSLVVDIMAANGEEEPPVPQRIFWALTEGATAIALLYSGKNVLGPFGDPGQGGLRALQAASIIMGLPYTFMLFWYSQALVQVCREEAGELDPERPRFKMFLVDIPGSDKVPVGKAFIILLLNTFLPGISPAVRAATTNWPYAKITKGWMWPVVLQLLYFAAITCCFVAIVEYNVLMMGASLYFGFAAFVSLIRREIRSQWGIPRGDFVTDFMWSVLAPMFVLTHLEVQMKEVKVDSFLLSPLKEEKEVKQTKATKEEQEADDGADAAQENNSKGETKTAEIMDI
jgi:choline-glycine betaine transporter